MDVEVVACGTGTAEQELRRLVAELVGTDASQVRVGRACGRCGSADHGRPVVVAPRDSGVHVSTSRAGDLVLVAATRAGPVGVDVEGTSAGPGADLVAWTRTEALVKADGRGLPVLDEDPPPTWDGYRVVRLDLGPRHVAALALRADEEPRVHLERRGHDGSGGSAV